MRPLLFCLFVLPLGPAICPAQPLVLYPGDTNNDGTANHFDLLPIGVAYGMEGIPRQNASFDWQPQLLFPVWADALPVSGINKGFVDCDGNGFIDTFDIEAIVLNYDKIQAGSQPPPMPYPPKLADTCFSCPKPEIQITYSQDTLMTSDSGFDTLYATVMLIYPPGVPSAAGALGIAFDVEYDYNPDKIKDSLTEVYPDTFPDNRMYVIATSTKAQFWRLPSPGRIGFAAAGRGQNVFFSPDTLFTVRYIITDMIIRGAEKFSLKISNALLINKFEQVVCLGGIIQKPVVITSPVSEPKGVQPVVYLSPNPVHNMLSIESPESPVEKIRVFRPDGAQAMSVDINGQRKIELPVSVLPSGIWIMAVYSPAGVFVTKFVRL